MQNNMFNYLLLDSFDTYNNGLGFLETQVDILTHLIHWQYWWWFWFTYLLSLYYLFFIKFITTRPLKFFPKITTSFRSRGKWGDYIICVLPISWCLNILTNSTTLLKLLEWQSESNFFTLRVRGKQWYWVYKIDLRSMENIIYNTDLNKHLGTKILNINFLSNKHTFCFFDNLWYKNFNKAVVLKLIELVDTKKLFNTHGLDNSKTQLGFVGTSLYDNYVQQKVVFSKESNVCKNLYNIQNNTKIFFKKNPLKQINYYGLNTGVSFKLIDFNLSRGFRDIILRNFRFKILRTTGFEYINNNQIISNRFSFLKNKQIPDVYYSVIKQKPISDWLKTSDLVFNEFGSSTGLSNKKIDNLMLQHDSTKLSNLNNSRLLRLNKMLFLPTNLQINIITNSFDVIHSWFIPGLGLKMDCVPGRSTHHTLYIDVPGIYYGQCAEICGRFHHHMPIRICALEYEHFYLCFVHFNSLLLMNSDYDDNNIKFKKNIQTQLLLF